jgi:ABC-2 type transport system ATP-binding protein
MTSGAVIAADRAASAETRRDEIAVRVRGLHRGYGSVEAVRNLGLEIHRGRIFGLIGPDGAGKTTTFQILAGIMEPTGGGVEVFGRPARQSRSVVGYLTQSFSFYPDLSVAENIRYVGDLRRVPADEIRKRSDQYLRMFDMDRFKSRLAGRLSGGMKQKLSLVCALVAQPQVLLLDEPTTGVDPVSRREFWDALAHLATEGLTIVVATPYLDEAERCHLVALMHLGQVRQLGTPAELRERLHAKRLEVRTDKLGPAEDQLANLSRKGPNGSIRDVQRFGYRLDVIVSDAETGTETVKRAFAHSDIRIRNIRTADSVELVQAQESVASSNLDYIDSVFAYNLAKIALARSLGNTEQNVMQFLHLQ